MQVLYKMGLDARKPLLGVFKQQMHRPACAFAQTDQRLFIPDLEYIVSILAAGENLVFLLVSVAEVYWFESRFIGNPEDRFVASRPINDDV